MSKIIGVGGILFPLRN